MDSLTDEAFSQVYNFQKFFRSKRELALEQIQCDFDDTKNDSVTEDMYSLDEVHSLFDSISNVVKDTTRVEVGSMINMTVLLFAQLFTQAEDEGVQLEMDTSVIEDQRLLEEVEKMTLEKKQRAAGKGARLKDTLAQTKKDLMQCESDLELTKGKLKGSESDRKAQKKEIKQLKRKVKELAVFADLKNKDGPAEAPKDEGKEQESKDGDDNDHAADEAAEEEELEEELADCSKDEVVRKLKAAKRRIKYLNNEMDKRLADSKQFKQLKKLMQQKNTDLMDVRERLAKYEPDALDEEDM